MIFVDVFAKLILHFAAKLLLILSLFGFRVYNEEDLDFGLLDIWGVSLPWISSVESPSGFEPLVWTPVLGVPDFLVTDLFGVDVTEEAYLFWVFCCLLGDLPPLLVAGFLFPLEPGMLIACS